MLQIISAASAIRTRCSPPTERIWPPDPQDLPFVMDAFLRINAHGELINDHHFENICRLAEKNPHCSIALWTKRPDIVNRVLRGRSKPGNLILIYSNPKIEQRAGKSGRRPPELHRAALQGLHALLHAGQRGRHHRRKGQEILMAGRKPPFPLGNNLYPRERGRRASDPGRWPPAAGPRTTRRGPQGLGSGAAGPPAGGRRALDLVSCQE